MAAELAMARGGCPLAGAAEDDYAGRGSIGRENIPNVGGASSSDECSS